MKTACTQGMSGKPGTDIGLGGASIAVREQLNPHRNVFITFSISVFGPE
jgi:hypothetical protein